MKFEQIINESNKTLNASIKRKVNKDLTKFTFNKYFDAIPIKNIKDILKKYRIVLLQEDRTEWDGFLTGSDGNGNFEIGSIDSSMGGEVFEVYRNCFLNLMWHKMQSGRYEITVYVG